MRVTNKKTKTRPTGVVLLLQVRNEKSTTAAMQDAITTLIVQRMQAGIAMPKRKEVVDDQDTGLADIVLQAVGVEVIEEVGEDVVGGVGAVVVEEVMSAMAVRTEGATTTMMNTSVVRKEQSTGH